MRLVFGMNGIVFFLLVSAVVACFLFVLYRILSWAERKPRTSFPYSYHP